MAPVQATLPLGDRKRPSHRAATALEKAQQDRKRPVREAARAAAEVVADLQVLIFSSTFPFEESIAFGTRGRPRRRRGRSRPADSTPLPFRQRSRVEQSKAEFFYSLPAYSCAI